MCVCVCVIKQFCTGKYKETGGRGHRCLPHKFLVGQNILHSSARKALSRGAGAALQRHAFSSPEKA